MSWPPDRINLTCHSDSHYRLMPVCRSTVPVVAATLIILFLERKVPRVRYRFAEPSTELMWHQKQNADLEYEALNWSSYYGILYKYRRSFNRYQLIFWGECATCQMPIHWNGNKDDVAERTKLQFCMWSIELVMILWYSCGRPHKCMHNNLDLEDIPRY